MFYNWIYTAEVRKMDFQNRAIDVICQHTREGNMIPIKIHIQDEEGEFQTFVVKSYKDLSHKGNFTMPTVSRSRSLSDSPICRHRRRNSGVVISRSVWRSFF